MYYISLYRLFSTILYYTINRVGILVCFVMKPHIKAYIIIHVHITFMFLGYMDVCTSRGEGVGETSAWEVAVTPAMDIPHTVTPPAS